MGTGQGQAAGQVQGQDRKIRVDMSDMRFYNEHMNKCSYIKDHISDRVCFGKGIIYYEKEI